MQVLLLEALLAACKAEGLHTCIETCGRCDPAVIRAIQPVTDLFLVDWELSDEQEHRSYTGVSNRQILQNLALLSGLGAKVVLRCPLIPEINLTESHYDGIVKLAGRYPNITHIDLEPYHPMGLENLIALGTGASYRNEDFLPIEKAQQIAAYLSKRATIPVTVSGK